ncbi:MAG TPA: hypothetical protein VK735_46375 [Pseudonocardia sp.]|uniref:hypothetical protein n=1 Tax=Pseudonocardia sp. TaxID=60912 RepID=UPI002C3A8DC3|nr:hypothetical protein [Pseudonocardia sp.]HTF54917.1 hypothetical protein [Pseudonocardia sp.]
MAARQRSGVAKGWFAGLLLFFVIVGSCNAGGQDEPPSASPPTPTTTPIPPSPCPYGSTSISTYDGQGGCQPGGELVTIARIHDAATYILTDGRQVRLAGLVAQGVDTCGGSEALRALRTVIAEGQTLNLVRDPAAGTDPFGSQWAYLQFDTSYMQDLGQALAASGYADVYPQSGANPTYLRKIAQHVESAKQLHSGQFGPPCAPALNPPNLPATDDRPSGPATDNRRNRENVPDQEYTPDPPKRHTGNSGHPCLPRERDGDGDGYCGEGR